MLSFELGEARCRENSGLGSVEILGRGCEIRKLTANCMRFEC